MKTIARSCSTARLAVILLLFYAGPAPAQEKTVPEKVRIAIATGSLAFLVPFVAKDRGLYLKHGSDVELIQCVPTSRSRRC